jgi:hypothetical protein
LYGSRTGRAKFGLLVEKVRLVRLKSEFGDTGLPISLDCSVLDCTVEGPTNDGLTSVDDEAGPVAQYAQESRAPCLTIMVKDGL